MNDDGHTYQNGLLVPEDLANVDEFWTHLDEAEEVTMNRTLIVLSLAAVTFIQGFLGALIAGGLTDLSVSTLQAAAVGAVGGALSVLVNGVGKLHAYLSARANL